MAGILKALGFENKPEYLEKIPETLTPSDFTVHNTFHHGFPSQPICLAYDALQQLLAIGTETGAILLLGKPALERYFSHPKQVAILQMLFITNKGLLVTRCDNKTLYLWSLEEKEPTVIHSLEFNKENPTSVSHTYGSPWLYVGTEKGNVHAVHVETFMVSGYTIYWNECTDQTTQRRTPGEIIYVQEHPIDQGKVLVAFSSNLCVLWNLKNKGMEKRYFYNPADHHIMTSVCWLGNGKSFATSYSDGSIIIWNAKVDNRPEKIFFPHGNDSHAFQPIYKLQVLYTDSEPWYICSGGFPEDHLTSPQTLTIQHGRSSTLLSASSTIMDFICLPSSPFVTEIQKPFALVVLAKNELIVHDLQTLGFPAFSLPYGLDLHTPSVTCIEYYGNCPEEFVASLHSVKSKMMCDTKSTKPWPMKGGKWGEESPHQMTDLILTGHTDGSVRLWYCSSVIFQPFFTISTSRYFKMLYATLSPPHKPKPTKRQAPKRPPPPVPKTAQPQGKSPQTQRQQTIDVARSGADDDSSEVTTSVPKSISSPAIMTMRVKTPDEEEFEVLQLPEGNGSGRGNGNGDRRSVSPNGEQDTPYPATGQVGPEVTASTEGIDGTQSTDLGQSTASINSDRKTVFSREKRSFFKKKSKDERERSDMLLSASTKEDKAKPKSHSSFRKQATKIIFGRKKGHSKRHATLEEVDAATAPTEEREEDQLERTLDAAEGRGETEYPSDLQMPASEGLQTPSSPGIVFTPTPTQTPTPARTPTPQTPTSAPALTPTRTMTPTQAPTPAESPTNEPPPRSKTPSELRPPASPQAPRDVASASATSPRNADEERSAQEPPTGVTATTQDDARKSPTGAGSTSSAEARKSPTGSGSMSSAEARKLPTGAGSTSPGEARKSPTVSTTATSSEKSVPQSEVVTLNEEDFFAIREINLCVWGQWLCVATTGGGVLAFAFHMEKRYRTPQSLNIDFSTDSVLNHSDATNNGATGPSPKAASAPGWVFQERVQDSHPGFYLLQHCQCLCSAGKQSPVVVSTMQFGLDFGLLAIGTNLGLAVVDTLKNTCLYTLSNLTTILYLAEPSKFSKQVMRESNMAAEARKPPILRRQTTRSLPNSPVSPLKSLSMSQLTNLKTPATPGEKEVGVAQADQPDFLCVEEHDHSVTSLQLVQLHLDKHLPPTLTLWVGTVSGKVAAYGVNIVPEKEGEAKNHRKIELIPTNLILDHKSPIVSLHFLNEWGDRQVVPYKPPRTIGQGVRTAEGREVQRNTATANATSNRRVRNYAIVVEEQRLRSLSFPGMLTISKCAVPLENDNVILTSEYFYCSDLPCLLSVTSCLQMHVHSLPGLKPLMSAPYPALIDPRAMCTFTVTGDGQLLYMTSPSEVQRACITKKDRLNLPACLPDSHVPTEDPQPASKGIISNLFSSGPVEINREATFGESAGRPYTSLAKRDGRSGCAYIKRQVDREMERGPRGIGGSSAGGLGGQFNKNREALDKRGKELSQLEQQTELMSSDAGEFAALTEQLRKKYGK